MIYTLARVHASGPADRSGPTLFVGPTVLPPHHPGHTCARAHSCWPAWYVRRWCGNGQRATRQQHNAANTGTDKIGIRTAMSRTPAGTHAFFARNLPTVVRTYICSLSLSLSALPTCLVVIIRMNEGSLPFLVAPEEGPADTTEGKREREVEASATVERRVTSYRTSALPSVFPDPLHPHPPTRGILCATLSFFTARRVTVRPTWWKLGASCCRLDFIQ